MSDQEHRRMGGGGSCDVVEGGYSIFLDEETIRAFMESGDFSSARELDHFKEVEAQVEKKIMEGEGFSLMALSVNDNRISRDFTVLQIAHILAKHGKRVLIVDCDFLKPGLNGLVENADQHGFLDLLLYGSSLKSVMNPSGIDGVSITGPGSFPVSRTVPFAQKEFEKVEQFLSDKNDIVIYCSTLYTEDKIINPLCHLVDGIILCCRIEEMEEGQLQRNLKDLGSDVPPVDLVCFFSGEGRIPSAAGVRVDEGEKTEEPVREAAGAADGREEEQPEAAYIEKTEEIEEVPEREGSWLNLPRLITIVAAVVIVAFLAWWFITDRIIRDKSSSDKMSELVLKQREARDAGEKKSEEPAITDSSASKESSDEAVTGMVPKNEAKEPAIKPPVEQAAPTGARYMVHVSSFRDIERAGREQEYLERNGFESEIVEVDVRGEKWFRVLVGEFSTQEEAQEAKIQLLALKRVGSARVVKLKDR